MFFSASSDHTVRSWPLDVDQCTRVYKSHTHTVNYISVLEGSLLTSCGDGNVRAFDAKSGALRRTFKGHKMPCNAFQICGDRMYTISHDTTLRVWNLVDLHLDPVALKKKRQIEEKERIKAIRAEEEARKRDVEEEKKRALEEEKKRAVEEGRKETLIQEEEAAAAAAAAAALEDAKHADERNSSSSSSSSSSSDEDPNADEEAKQAKQAKREERAERRLQREARRADRLAKQEEINNNDTKLDTTE